MTKRPPAVDAACWLLWLLVAAGLAVCVMVLVKRDDLGAVWSPMQVGDSTVQPVEFVPVILVLYGTTAVMAATLIALYRGGHNWARHFLAIIVFGVFLVTVATVRTEPPALVEWAAIAGAVICSVTLVFLWHPQSWHYMRLHSEYAEEAVEPPEASLRTSRSSRSSDAAQEAGAAS
ncbi:hypothetical protein L615_001900000050 [Nocardioides sp. J9]|uniref:hypothetical protein n=1 Tax=unclassified Nocardioides TaxID=2615069 RepID=UPI00048B4FA5|nr:MULTISPECIES: hypothetical protein [unclassified Nocardioides]TWH01324.1 hypothetical protein L615_001900000050 [Nocardioides sp. J9]